MTLKASYSYEAKFINALSSTSRSSHLNSFYLKTKSSGKNSSSSARPPKPIPPAPPGNILDLSYSSSFEV
jgi:hypothetical protein